LMFMARLFLSIVSMVPEMVTVVVGSSLACAQLGTARAVTNAKALSIIVTRLMFGLQTIWTRLGRHVVGNVTTVSTSVRDFTTLVLTVAIRLSRSFIDQSVP
jgi:hypothetical protein